MSSGKRNAVTGKLSSRVMNMKFMKHAEQVEEQKEEIENTKKLVDSSEWQIETNEKLLKRLHSRAKVVEHVGFSALRTLSESTDNNSGNSDSTTLRKVVNPGRRVFGSKISPVIQDTANSDNNDKKRSLGDEDEDIQTAELEKLWEAESQNKKRSSNGKKNKKQKKSSK